MRLRSDDNHVMLPGDKIVVRLFVKAFQFKREISPRNKKWSVRLEEGAKS